MRLAERQCRLSHYREALETLQAISGSTPSQIQAIGSTINHIEPIYRLLGT